MKECDNKYKKTVNDTIGEYRKRSVLFFFLDVLSRYTGRIRRRWDFRSYFER